MLASTSKQYVAEAVVARIERVCCETKSAGGVQDRAPRIATGHAFTRAQANLCGEVKYIAATRSNG